MAEMNCHLDIAVVDVDAVRLAVRKAAEEVLLDQLTGIVAAAFSAGVVVGMAVLLAVLR
jgi:DNA-binding FrmR family transcriptional regulator